MSTATKQRNLARVKQRSVPEKLLIRRSVTVGFGQFQKCGALVNAAPLFLSQLELEALNRDGVVLASDGYEYQIFDDPAARMRLVANQGRAQ